MNELGLVHVGDASPPIAGPNAHVSDWNPLFTETATCTLGCFPVKPRNARFDVSQTFFFEQMHHMFPEKFPMRKIARQPDFSVEDLPAGRSPFGRDWMIPCGVLRRYVAS
jgi:hypothetical protein